MEYFLHYCIGGFTLENDLNSSSITDYHMIGIAGFFFYSRNRCFHLVIFLEQWFHLNSKKNQSAVIQFLHIKLHTIIEKIINTAYTHTHTEELSLDNSGGSRKVAA